ncbi:MAG: hypothetical protein Fur0042_00850 [Cyanophyceae cyanobacterium]
MSSNSPAPKRDRRPLLDGRYRLVKVLGRGGTGVTYGARDLADGGRPVAIKILSLRGMSDWTALDLFEREMHVLATLNHPAIPRHLRSFQIDRPRDRVLGLVQEVAVGQSLAQLIRKGWRPNEAEVTAIARQVLEVLCYLHRFNPPVIHRDIKPQNLIYRPDGHIFLIDFGAVQQIYRRTVLGRNTFVGTLGYMPPEQFRGLAVGASDLYALGVTLVHLLTATAPEDLPEERLKLQFRSAAIASEPFAQWLDGLIEPALEHRTQSASGALRQLKRLTAPSPPKNQPDRNRPHHPPQTAYPQPAGSRARLVRTDRQLWLTVPYHLPWLNWPLAILALLMALGLWMGSHYFLAWAIMTATAMALGCAIASYRWGQCQLQISPDQFQLLWSIGGIQWRDRGPSTHLQITQQPESFSPLLLVDPLTVRTPLLVGDYRRSHPIGHNLTEIERQWLWAELTDFLQTLRRPAPPSE